MTEETPPVYRFEHWPDYNFEDPDLIRFIISSLPYFIPHVWDIQPEDSVEVQLEKTLLRVKNAHSLVMAQYPAAEWFAYKHYRNDFLVAIHMGYIVNAIEGREYHAIGFFLGDDENGSRDYAKNTRTAMRPVKEFMAQFGITSYKEYLQEGHPKIESHRTKYGFEPIAEEYKPNLIDGSMVKVFVYDMFAMLESGNEFFEYNGKKYW